MAPPPERQTGMKIHVAEETRQVGVRIEQTEALEQSAQTYGLTESAVSAMVASELQEAIAIASLNGARQESIDFLEEELDRRNKLTAAMEKNELARLLGNTKTSKKKKTDADVAALDRWLAEDPEGRKKQYDEAIAAIKGSVGELDQFTVQAARNMQTALSDFLFAPFSDGVQGMVKGFADAVRRMAADALAAQILKKLFGDMGNTGEIGAESWVGMALKAVGMFADGGIMTSAGPLPLNKYAGGGVATSPQMALFGEGSTPEAYVPLPDGRSIPVTMQGGGQPAPAQNIRIVNAFDVSVVGDYLGSSAGERIIMNAVQRNAGAFRQALA